MSHDIRPSLQYQDCIHSLTLVTSPLTFLTLKLVYVTWTNFVSILRFAELFVLALLPEINETDRQAVIQSKAVTRDGLGVKTL